MPRVGLLHLVGGVQGVVHGGLCLGKVGGEFGEAVGGHRCCGWCISETDARPKNYNNYFQKLSACVRPSNQPSARVAPFARREQNETRTSRLGLGIFTPPPSRRWRPPRRWPPPSSRGRPPPSRRRRYSGDPSEGRSGRSGCPPRHGRQSPAPARWGRCGRGG